MKDKNCFSCGEEKAQVRIINPNSFENEEEMYWDVCVIYKKIIEQQQKLSFGLILRERNNPVAEKMSKRIIDESNDEIKKLSYESGKEVISMEFRKK